jgi:uncharacterized protein YdbL (DUF1318 family)
MCSRRVLLAAAAAVLPLPSRTAFALTLDEAKAQGLVGERPDGFVGIVDPKAPAEVRALVEEVNAKRREAYAQIAKKNGVPFDAVAALAGKKLIEKTPPGQWVMDEKGNWVRR